MPRALLGRLPVWWRGSELDRLSRPSCVVFSGLRCFAMLMICSLLRGVFCYLFFLLLDCVACLPSLVCGFFLLFELLCSVATMEHAMQCVARVLRVLMGPSSVASDKVSCGRSLIVLGVELSCHEEVACFMFFSCAMTWFFSRLRLAAVHCSSAFLLAGLRLQTSS